MLGPNRAPAAIGALDILGANGAGGFEGGREVVRGQSAVRVQFREVHLGDPVQVSVYLIATDEKRLHTFEELRHATEGWISATSENMTLHVDMAARKTAPFPPDIAARIRDVIAAHGTIPKPDGIGRRVAMPAK